MVYRMKVAGLERDLPLCPISDELYIGAFILFGDVEEFQGVEIGHVPVVFLYGVAVGLEFSVF